MFSLYMMNVEIPTAKMQIFDVIACKRRAIQIPYLELDHLFVQINVLQSLGITNSVGNLQICLK